MVGAPPCTLIGRSLAPPLCTLPEFSNKSWLKEENKCENNRILFINIEVFATKMKNQLEQRGRSHSVLLIKEVSPRTRAGSNTLSNTATLESSFCCKTGIFVLLFLLKNKFCYELTSNTTMNLYWNFHVCKVQTLEGLHLRGGPSALHCWGPPQ
jgi:hypothetical protein